MHQSQRAQTHELLKQRGVARALFAFPGNITWLTGFARPWRPGADLYAGGPPLVWYENGEFTLVVLDAQAAEAAAFGEQPNCQVVSYLGYTIEEFPAGAPNLATVLHQLILQSGPFAGKIGMESFSMPAFLWTTVREALSSQGDLVPIDDWLVPLRIIRTNEELAKMRQNFAIIDVGQAAARQAVQVGNRELDVWLAIHNAMQKAAGETLPLGNDCTVGRRNGGPALDVEILPTDSFVVDLSTMLHGYWSDSCATYYATEPTSRQISMHQITAEALDLAISLARPGAVAREIDQQVRQFIAAAGFPVYPHHTGHGIGVIGHERPRIVPHSEEVLQQGMVLMLEPGIYFPNETSVRLEHAILITADGAEILTKYDQSLP